MKKLFLISFLLSAFAFAQNKTESETLPKLPKSYQTITKVKQPTFMINDSLIDKKLTVKLNLDQIQNIVIVKDNPNYPDGLIKITTHK